jgi:hypothetical protein
MEEFKKHIRSRLLEEIKALKGKDISIVEIDARLFNYLMNMSDDEIQKEYNALIMEQIPF